MAAKKNTRKKQTRLKRTARKKVMAAKKLAEKRAILKKKSAAKRPARKKAAVKTKAAGKKTTGAKTVGAGKKQHRGKSQRRYAVAFSHEGLESRSGGQSGDLQGLSNVEGADSESVSELLEEGNAFEAEVVKGVEDAGDLDERGVRTHEAPEDDLPGEYLDKE